MRGSAEIVVNRPIEDIWEFVSNIENMDRWVDGVSEPERTAEGQFGVGSAFKSKFSYRGKTFDFSYRVTAFNPPVLFGAESTEGPFPFEGTITLERSGEGTMITNTVEVGSDSWATSVMFAVLGPILRKAMCGRLVKEFERLKAELES